MPRNVDDDFLRLPPRSAGRPADAGLDPRWEWAINLAWVVAAHVGIAVNLHRFHVPVVSAGEEVGLLAWAVATAIFAVMTFVWLWFVGKHFVEPRERDRWMHRRWIRVGFTVAFVFVTSPMLYAAEGSLVAFANGHAQPSVSRAVVIAAWLALAFVIAKYFNPFDYVAEVAGDDTQRCRALLMFVSDANVDAARELDDVLDSIATDAQGAPPTDAASLGDRIDARLRYRSSDGSDRPHGVLEHEFVQNLRGIRPHFASLEHVYLLASKDTPDRAAKLAETIERWRDAYRRLHAETVADAAGNFKIHAAVAAPSDYDDFHDVERQIAETIGDLARRAPKLPPGEIVIDMTSGKKPNSAAALLYTLGRPVRAQYVRPDGKTDRVRTYDVHPVSRIGGG